MTTIFPRENIFSKVITYDPGNEGGFLIAPEQELFNGFALVSFLNEEPENRFAQIRAFCEIIFQNRENFLVAPPKFIAQNATFSTGLAGRFARSIGRFGIDISKIENAPEKSKFTTIEFYETKRNEKIIEILGKFFSATLIRKPVPKLETVDSREISKVKNFTAEKLDEIKITLGDDYGGILRIPDFNFEN